MNSQLGSFYIYFTFISGGMTLVLYGGKTRNLCALANIEVYNDLILSVVTGKCPCWGSLSPLSWIFLVPSFFIVKLWLNYPDLWLISNSNNLSAQGLMMVCGASKYLGLEFKGLLEFTCGCWHLPSSLFLFEWKFLRIRTVSYHE